jgi:SAM-dependent methyltransferase
VPSSVAAADILLLFTTHTTMSIRKGFWNMYRQVKRRVSGVPDIGRVDFGQLRRITPFERSFGEARGQALDRYYIEAFLERRARDVNGRVLEIGEDKYTRRFGAERVLRSDVLHVKAGNPQATIVADLASAPHIPDATFDTLIVTQTLHLIYDPIAALRTIHRILKPGGVLLLTVPGITQIPHGTLWADTWFWAFTPLSVNRMLTDVFAGGAVEIEQTGNVLSATALLYGLSSADLAPHELDAIDPDYPVIITARAVRASN